MFFLGFFFPKSDIGTEKNYKLQKKGRKRKTKNNKKEKN